MKRLATACVLFLFLALPACGGSSDSSSEEQTGSAAVAEPAVGKTESNGAENMTEDVDPDVLAVIEATEESYQAVIDRDSEAVCATSTSTFEGQVTAYADGGSCEEAVAELLEKIPDEQIKQEEQELEELSPANVELKGDEAIVTFPHEEMIFIRAGDKWLNEGSHDRGP